jgi:hypothetical protein
MPIKASRGAEPDGGKPEEGVSEYSLFRSFCRLSHVCNQKDLHEGVGGCELERKERSYIYEAKRGKRTRACVCVARQTHQSNLKDVYWGWEMDVYSWMWDWKMMSMGWFM